MYRVMALLASVVLCVSTLGCGDGGPSLGKVTGKVTMDGQPLPNSLVTFVPEAGGTASTGITDSEGKYQLGHVGRHGAVVGKHKVSVTTIQPVADAPVSMSSDDPEYAKQGGAAAYKQAAKKNVEKIPERYNKTTTLQKEVTPGENVIDLELTTKG